MGWESIIALIIKYGIDQAYRIWQIAKAGEPTEEAWEQLRALSLKTYDEYIAAARERALKLPPDPQTTALDPTKPDV